ncbi:MAG: tRNA lysidine(34) synthetase TilS, partial [Actinomycetota bacterium]|nr:tRNA lysidine(34) synthetase TilS [Actinomycetota bacterium]
NYGLREHSDADERHCARLCEQLQIELVSVREPRSPALAAALGGGAAQGAPATRAGSGNLQAWAREVRYRAAGARALERGAQIATAHTASDQVETILYRLAASPGRRALLGMQAVQAGRPGPRLIRPLLGVSREHTAAYCSERGLRWRDDESNCDEQYARVRVRQGLLPALRAVHPAAEASVLKTAQLLREEAEVLDGLVSDELAGAQEISIARLAALPAALARLLVIALAEHAAGTYVPQAGARVQEILALGRRGGRAELHVGGQAGAVIEGGLLRMVKLPPRGTPLARGGDGRLEGELDSPTWPVPRAP